jgi:hypothetical protein
VNDPALDFVRPDSQYNELKKEKRQFNGDEFFMGGLALSDENINNEETLDKNDNEDFLEEDVKHGESQAYKEQNGDYLEVLVGGLFEGETGLTGFLVGGKGGTLLGVDEVAGDALHDEEEEDHV